MHRLVVADEIFLEVVHDTDDAVENLRGRRALHQQPLGAEHFRDFRENGAAARCRDAIGDASHQRIRADAAETVGAAAFQSDR